MLKLDRIETEFCQRYPDRIFTIDSHTQGEPTRLLIGGVDTLPGSTMKDKRDYFESHYDHVRMLLTREPRGHRGIMAAVVTEPVSPEGQFGLFYMDARRYPYLCGHGTIGAVATLIEVGVLRTEGDDTVITVDSPSGNVGGRLAALAGRSRYHVGTGNPRQDRFGRGRVRASIRTSRCSTRGRRHSAG